jgi:hypothetical protein
MRMKLLAGALTSALLWAQPLQAQDWPQRTVSLVEPVSLLACKMYWFSLARYSAIQRRYVNRFASSKPLVGVMMLSFAACGIAA